MRIKWEASISLVKSDVSVFGEWVTHSAGTSRPVVMSVITRRTHGGGVTGRRSCGSGELLSILSQDMAYLVAEAAHTSADGLLGDDKATLSVSFSLKAAERLTRIDSCR